MRGGKERWQTAGEKLMRQQGGSAKQIALRKALDTVAEIRAAKEEKARAQELHRLREEEIDKAGKEAARLASQSPPKSVAELKGVKDNRLSKREELTATLSNIQREREMSLKGNVGEAMLLRGIDTFELMKEWDTNGDGELDREEFRTAIRSTLKIKASNKRIDELFDSLDEDRDGVLLIKTEVRPAIRSIHVFCKDGHAREKSALAEVEACSKQLKELEECISAAHKWEGIHLQLRAMQSSCPLEVKLAEIISDKLKPDMGGFTEWDIITQMGGGGDALVAKETFTRAMVEKKGEYGLESVGMSELRDMLATLFDSMVDAVPQGDDLEAKMNIRSALKEMASSLAAHKAKEAKLVAAERKFMEKARSLQVTYLENSSRFDKRLELDRKGLTAPTAEMIARDGRANF